MRSVLSEVIATMGACGIMLAVLILIGVAFTFAINCIIAWILVHLAALIIGFTVTKKIILITALCLTVISCIK